MDALSRCTMPKPITPKFIPWSELDFWNDPVVVQAMNWMQRHLYRALLLKAHVCATRPYLPDDDNQLWLLADAGSLKNWMDNKEPILQKFTRDVIEGVPVLCHKRVLEDWANTASFYESKREAGRKSAEARGQQKATGVEHVWNKGQLTEYKTETESNSVKQSQSPTSTSETDSVSSSLIQPQSSQSTPSDSATPPTQFDTLWEVSCAALRRETVEPELMWCKRMAQRWIDLRRQAKYKGHADVISHKDFAKLISPAWQTKAGFRRPILREEIENCMAWALLQSCREDHPKDWGNPDVLSGTDGFVKAFGAIQTQCFNYQSKIKWEKSGSNPGRTKSKPGSFPEPSQNGSFLPTEPETRSAYEIQKDKELNSFLAELQDRSINTDEKVKERMLSDRYKQLKEQGMDSFDRAAQIDRERRELSVAQIAELLGAEKLDKYMVGIERKKSMPMVAVEVSDVEDL